MNRTNNIDILAINYRNAFESHYPNVVLDVRTRRRQGKWLFDVIINGARGRPLSEEEVREAIELFNA